MEIDYSKEEEILREAKDKASYVHKSIVKDPESGNYLIHNLARSGKHIGLLAEYDSDGLLKCLDALNKVKERFDHFRIKFEGIYYTEPKKLIEVLDLEKGVKTV